MTGEYSKFYEETARAISFDGFGRASHRLGGEKRIASRGGEPDERWIDAVEEAVWPLLYQWHYLRDRRRVSERRERTMKEREDPEFVARLSEANRSAGVLEPGWRVVMRGPEECICEKGDLRLRVRTACLQADGKDVAVRFPAERRHWMPLYYCTGGGVPAEVNLRIYFHVKAESAAWLLRVLSEAFLEAGASYQLKLLNHPQSYTRPDSAVLYVPAVSVGISRAVVERVMAEGDSTFRVAVPAMTRWIGKGIAVADEPHAVRGRQVSFGQHRCRILARGIARSYVNGRRSVSDTVEGICREFVMEKIDPARPYGMAAAEF